MNNQADFAFIVHPRDYGDIISNIKITKFLPRSFVIKALKYIRPYIVSEINGLKSLDDRQELKGLVIGILLFPKDIIENRNLTRKRIEQAVDLAKKNGARVVGLGGLLGSVSEGGASLTKRKEIIVTAGRAYTAFVVIQYVYNSINKFNLNKKNTTVAIIGAAGGVGSTVIKVLSKEKFKKIILIDLERKLERIHTFLEKIKKNNTDIYISHKIHDVIEADIIITATNAPEAVLKSEDIKTGAIIVDDAQPSDISQEVMESRKDIIIIEAGVITAENIQVGTNFRLTNKNEIYCCLGEVMAIVASKWQGDYSGNGISIETINQIALIAEKIGFKLAPYQSFGKLVLPETIIKVKEIISSRNSQ